MRSGSAARMRLLGGHDPACAALVSRLLRIATAALPRAYADGRFARTLRLGRAGPRPEGVSARYSSIAGLGLAHLAEPGQRAVLAGDDAADLTGKLAKGIDDLTEPGDVALLCWLAAETGHSELPHAIDRLGVLDQGSQQVSVVSAAWVVTALTAARALVDVERHLAAARGRLLGARRALFPHVIGGSQPWYRAHVGSFADQIYPVQALARLHSSADDQAALAAAEHVAGVLCQAQGADGQWWWHYDARTGAVVERYPVYSVHQHAMAPMALLDLAQAGGSAHLGPICQGLRWLAEPAETREPLVASEVIWRKVARRDPAKLVRGVAAARTAIWPGAPGPGRHRPGLGRIFPPGAIDYECRPYELGWLLYAWLSGAAA